MGRKQGLDASLSGGAKKDADYYKTARQHAEAQRHKSCVSGVTNRDFAKDNGNFKDCCEAAGVDPSPRQASKFRNHHGAAFAAGVMKGMVK